MIFAELNIFQKKFKKIIGNKNFTTNICRIQAYHSIICVYFYIGFIYFILKSKSLLYYPNLFSPDDYEKNDKIIPKYFQWLKRWKKIYCIICKNYRKFEKPKISYILEKTLVLSIICIKCKSKNETLFK